MAIQGGVEGVGGGVELKGGLFPEKNKTFLGIEDLARNWKTWEIDVKT